MKDLSKVRIAGPLASWRARLTTEFLRLGYAQSTAARHLQLMAHLSVWMADHEVSVEELAWPQIEIFCSDHGLTGTHRFAPGNAPHSMTVLMGVLHPDCVAVLSAWGPVLSVEFEDLLRCFGSYLCDERALTLRTTRGYLYHVRVFASWRAQHGGSDVGEVTIAEVNHFLIERLTRGSTSSARSARIALRAFLRWLFLVGHCQRNLADGVIAVAHSAQADLPKALPAADVQSLLAVDMSTRDRAILVVLVRLGLRSGEVAGLSLDDFDWHGGTVRIHGKGGDCQLMPVPAQVGEAIAEYLCRHRRPGSPYRHIFLTSKAPYRSLSPTGVSELVTALARRAGIDGRVSAHQLRHSAATAVLADGGTLAEAGQLLRHRSAQVTAIYARVDHSMLTQIMRPWPTSAIEDQG